MMRAGDILSVSVDTGEEFLVRVEAGELAVEAMSPDSTGRGGTIYRAVRDPSEDEVARGLASDIRSATGIHTTRYLTLDRARVLIAVLQGLVDAGKLTE